MFFSHRYPKLDIPVDVVLGESRIFAGNEHQAQADFAGSSAKLLDAAAKKLLDALQNPARRAYQSLGYSESSLVSKGPYPVFDNVAAIFAATGKRIRDLPIKHHSLKRA